MTPQRLHVGVMDSQRAGLEVTLPVRSWSGLTRVWRGLWRLLAVAVVGGVLVFVPMLHVCGAVIAAFVAPLLATLAWMQQAELGAGEVPCPKCSTVLPLAPGLKGWPARLQCLDCKAAVEIKPWSAPS